MDLRVMNKTWGDEYAFTNTARSPYSTILEYSTATNNLTYANLTQNPDVVRHLTANDVCTLCMFDELRWLAIKSYHILEV